MKLSKTLLLIINLAIPSFSEDIFDQFLDSNTTAKPKAVVVEANSDSTLISESESIFNHQEERTQKTDKSLKQLDKSISRKGKASALDFTALTTNTLNLVDLYGRADDLSEALRRSPGIQVRQNGATGSDVEISLNGLSGDAVRVYYDGMPIEYLGAGVSLANLPVNSLEKIEIYKGVMPVRFGTDALGGGVNIISRSSQKDYAEGSYEIGSFETHKATLMLWKNLGTHIGVGINSFSSLSRNNYSMDAPISNLVENGVDRFDSTKTLYKLVRDTSRVTRFHDYFENYFIESQLKIIDIPYLEKLNYSFAISKSEKDYQNGSRIGQNAYGEVEGIVEGLIHRVQYENRFSSKLKISAHSVFSITDQFSKDYSPYVYDWNGVAKFDDKGTGIADYSESSTSPRDRISKTNNWAHRLGLQWFLSDNTSISLSDFYAYDERTQEDRFDEGFKIGDETIDLLAIPSEMVKNIFGAEIEGHLLKEQITLFAFYKHYYHQSSAVDLLTMNNRFTPNKIIRAKNHENSHGFGTGIKYEFLDGISIRTNFERAVRIPNAKEIFGNYITIYPNYSLSSEKSDNFNAGIYLNREFEDKHSVDLQFNWFLRQQDNLIKARPFGLESSRYQNESKVDATGLEFAISLRAFEYFKNSYHLTWQEVAIAEAKQNGEESSVGQQLANVPTLLMNNETSLSSPEWSWGRINLYYTVHFVEEFSITEGNESEGNIDNIIPVQLIQSTGINYSFPNHSISINLQIKNLYDEDAFDNYRLPKPGRAFSLKLKASI